MHIHKLVFAALFFICLVVLFLLPKNQASIAESGVSDGPHIFLSETQFDADWVCSGELVSVSYPIKNSLFEAKACGLSAMVQNSMYSETEVLEYKGDYAVAATSDFHGQYDVVSKLLFNNKIIDANQQWVFGNGNLVITGDVFSRGEKVTEILWLLYDLERQAALAGGRVHLLLGNHEVMTLNGDLRYLAAKYNEVAEKLNRPYEALFSKSSVLGNWLRSKPVLVKINNMLFAHGGFHPSLASEEYSLEHINRVFKNSLVEKELEKPREGWAKYLHKTNGPVWYRGYFAEERNKDDGASKEEIELLLHHFDVEHIIVGHTSQKQIETRYDGKVIAIDSSIKNGVYGEILFIDEGKKWRGTLTGEKRKLD